MTFRISLRTTLDCVLFWSVLTDYPPQNLPKTPSYIVGGLPHFGVLVLKHDVKASQQSKNYALLMGLLGSSLVDIELTFKA